eukprot:2821324-Pyramimonas_sp.AAC.1
MYKSFSYITAGALKSDVTIVVYSAAPPPPGRKIRGRIELPVVKRLVKGLFTEAFRFRRFSSVCKQLGGGLNSPAGRNVRAEPH